MSHSSATSSLARGTARQPSKTHLSESDLIEMARKAQTSWAKLAAASRNRKAATLKSFFKWLYQERKIDSDLNLQIHTPKVPKKIPHFISVDEVLSVIELLKPSELNEEKKLFFLLYGAGLRISEACSLQWDQISFATSTIRIKGKGGKERMAALPKSIATELQASSKKIQSDYVFGEAPLNPRKGYELIRKLGKKAGLKNPLHPHALRHSFATHLLNGGANLRVIQSLLGHESLIATEKYTHLSIDQLARTMDQIHPLSKPQKK